MPVISEQQARVYARAAGFVGQSQDIIIAIAHAESRLNTTATNAVGNSAGVDRGILQINSAYHPQVNDRQAFDPAFSFAYSYQISNKGTNFKPWSAYNNGSYRKFLRSGAINNPPAATPTKTADINSYARYMLPRLTRVGEGWGTARPGTTGYHTGIDLLAPCGTPIISPISGKVIHDRVGPKGFEGFYLYVQEDRSDGRIVYHYFGHRQATTGLTGKRITKGQQIGLVGNSGTNGGVCHVHYEIQPNGRAVDVVKYLAGNPAVLLPPNDDGTIPISPPTDTGGGGIPSVLAPVAGAYTSISYGINDTLASIPGFEGICIALDQAETFPGIITYEASATDLGGVGAAMRSTGATIWANAIALSTRLLIFLIGLILFIGLAWNGIRVTVGIPKL